MNAKRTGRRMYKIVMAVVSLQVAFVAFFGGASQAFANQQTVNDLKKGETLIYYAGQSEYTNSQWFKGKVTNVKVGNKKVLTAQKESRDGSWGLNLTAKKAGQTRISYTYKGKKYNPLVKVVKYVNPVKKLKLGTLDIANKYRSTSYAFVSIGRLGGNKISVTPKANWKIQKIKGRSSGRQKTIRNQSIIPESTIGITITLKNTKTGIVQVLTTTAYPG